MEDIMSAHKRATISLTAEDYRRLEEASKRLRQVEANYQGLKEQLHRQRSAELWQAYQEMASRQADFQASLSGVDEGLAELEEQAGQALLEQVGVLHQQVEQLGENLWQDAAEVLAEQAERLAALESASQAAQLQQLQQRQQRTQRAQQKTQRSTLLALQALQGAGVVLDSLSQADLSPAARAEAEECSLSLQMAQDNLREGLYEAAVVTAQQAYVRLSGLRRRQEAARVRREALLRAGSERLVLLQEQLRQQAQARAIGLDGEVLEATIDVDWWSGGRLNALNQRLAGLAQQLDELGEEELLELHNQRLPELEGELEDILYQARREVLASQLRYNIAECVVEALREQGFAVQAGGYQERDMRSGYQAVVQHLDGSEVMLLVSGERGEVGRSQLDLYSLDRGMRTAHELRQRVKEMAASLRSRGLEVGQREERTDSRTGTATSGEHSLLHQPYAAS
jgi:hypothetical protein